jgi:hypothetical protein
LATTSGSVTYQDKGCATTDHVSVQIAGTTQQQSADIVVQPPITQGIEYVSVDTPNICLQGTGCTSVANVVFKVVNTSGVGQSGARVDFKLDDGSVNFADLGSTFGTTGTDGKVTVSVASRQTPTPVRITAQLHSDLSISTISNELTISGGLPVAGLSDAHTGISFASTKYALNYNLDGDSADLTLRLTDSHSAPAVDGTAVSLVSDGGTVVPPYCVTKSGTCAVKLVVSNPRPVNGRVHVMAYAKGQEYFVDVDGDGVKTSADTTFDDVPVGVCLDKNENGLCDLNSGEFVVGQSTNPAVGGTVNTGNTTWDGAGTAYARKTRLLFFSYTDRAPRLYKASGTTCTNTPVDNAYMTITLAGSSRGTLAFCLRDGNTNADGTGGNPVASGSTLSVTSSSTTFNASVDNSPVPAIVSGPTQHIVLIDNASTTTPQAAIVAGHVDLKITMGGNSYTFLSAVTVNP